MSAEVTWVEVSPFKWKGKTAPAWVRRAAMTADGEVYAPAAVAGSEMEILLCAGYDGTPLICDEDHIYAPCGWLAREFPATADTVGLIAERTRDYIASAAER